MLFIICVMLILIAIGLDLNFREGWITFMGCVVAGAIFGAVTLATYDEPIDPGLMTVNGESTYCAYLQREVNTRYLFPWGEPVEVNDFDKMECAPVDLGG